MPLNNIRIVLIQTSHPGNIGSAARAMKTMGLTQLYLVRPKEFPSDQALAMSSNANDILENAIVVETAQEALVDCQLVIGSSARHERTLSWDIVEPRECATQVATQAVTAPVALLFGRESSGLTNDELALCHHLVHIPTNPAYSSLNLASAVQILAYECRLAVQALSKKVSDSPKVDKNEEMVTADAMESYYQHLEKVLIEKAFLDPENPKYLMPRLRRLYGRAKVSKSELNILRGMLSAFQKEK